MTSQVQFVVSLVPLAAYLALIASWHLGRHPRVVSGLADFAFLVCGVFGLVTFGPIGQLLARAIFRKPDLLDWMTLASGLGLLASLLAHRRLRRIVVYHVDAEALNQALRDALDQGPARFVPTLRGFEDRLNARGILVEFSPTFRTALLEAFGRDPERLIQELRPRLQFRLQRMGPSPSKVAWWLFGLSGLVVLLPLACNLLSQPQTRAALRALIENLPGV